MSSIEGNVCEEGFNIVFDRVLSGELQLDTLFSGIVVRCRNGRDRRHTGLCVVLGFGECSFFRAAPADIYNWCRMYAATLCRRPNLISEIQTIMQHVPPIVVYVALAPLFAASKPLQSFCAPQIYLDKDISSQAAQLGCLIGIAKVKDTAIMSRITSYPTSFDYCLYRAFVSKTNLDGLAPPANLGPACGLYLSTVAIALERLPDELVLLVLWYVTGMRFAPWHLRCARAKYAILDNYALALTFISNY